MSYADIVFKETCRDILENGTDTKGEKVRPTWEDGSPAYTIKKFGVVNEYDLRKEFPALTLRRMYLKSAMDEMLWIYQKKSNVVAKLNSGVWDEWKQEDGTIGKAYGYQMNVKHIYNDITIEGLKKAFPAGKYVPYANTSVKKDGHFCKGVFFGDSRNIAFLTRGDEWIMDQIDKVIYDLKNTPFSRRIMTSMWNPEDLHEMALAPCAYSMTYNVTEEGGQLVLNAILNQRSQDMLAANGWNVAQYAILLMMIAREVKMIPGKLIHVIADCHIYDKHIPMIKELLAREEYPAPKVNLNPEVTKFYDFTKDDLIVEDYQFGEQIKDIPIAI